MKFKKGKLLRLKPILLINVYNWLSNNNCGKRGRIKYMKKIVSGTSC